MGAATADFSSFERILVLVEDDDNQRKELEETALRYFDQDSVLGILISKSAAEVSKEFENYVKEYPNASIYAVLDFNMGLNEAGDRKPTETLFYNKHFQYFLKNGGIVVLFSGYPEQVRQSQEIMNAPSRYEKLALLIAEKSKVKTDDIFRILKSMTLPKIPQLKKAADNCRLNLGHLIDATRRAKKRSK